MNSARRAAYLSAMGIAQWLPRDSDISAPDLPSSVSVDVVVADTKVAPVDVPAVAVSCDQTASAVPTFDFMCTVIGDVLIVDDVAEMQFAGSTYRQWLNAILLATARDPLEIDAQQRWVWPLTSAVSTDDSEQSAREMLAAWLARELEARQVNCALLMGQGVVGLCAVSPVSLGERVNLFGHGDIVAVATHSSRTLWENPALKRELLQHLQVL